MTIPTWAKKIDDPKNCIGHKVHVFGWNSGAVFILTDFYAGVSTLKTPKTGKTIHTRNSLYSLRKN